MKPIDLTGQIFGRLKVLRYDIKSVKSGHARWICICTCRKEKSVRASHLKTGNVRSCGCFAKEVSKSEKKRATMSRVQSGNKNSNWKDFPVYSTIHGWLSKNFHKSRCEECGGKVNLDWALKRGRKHSRNRLFYLVLCRKCHIKYDKS